MSNNSSIARFLFSSLFCLLISGSLASAQTLILQDSISWDETIQPVESQGFGQLSVMQFKGAVYQQQAPEIPRYHKIIRLDRPGQVSSAVFTNQQENRIALPSFKATTALTSNYNIEYYVTKDRNAHFLNVILTPLRVAGSALYQLQNFTLEINLEEIPAATSRSTFKTNSVLSNPGFYKLSIPESGMYKIDGEVLRKLGINPEQINPQHIRLYATRGGMVPEANNAPRTDDLEELSIFVSGEGDQRFDAGDFVLFFAEGPEQIQYLTAEQRVQVRNNIYDTNKYIFINVSLGPGKRISEAPSPGNSTYTSRHFNDWRHLEQDLVNIGHVSPFTTGAGKQWYGDNFRIVREKSFSGPFSFADRDWTSPVFVESVFAGRAAQASRFHLDINGRTLSSTSMGTTNLGNPDFPYARIGRIADTLRLEGNNIEIRLRFPDLPGTVSEGWLDYITVNARRKLVYGGQPLWFRDLLSTAHTNSTYIVENGSNALQLWNVSDIFQTKQIPFQLNGGELFFTDESVSLQQYVLFDPQFAFPKPETAGAVMPQNLHAMENCDLLIVYHPLFQNEALRLASHRTNETGLRVGLANVLEIYNEFSGGALDPVAIRDFVRMHYQRNPAFRYLLLFGDATFDYRNIYKIEGFQNLVPCWQTEQSLDPIFSFPSDDFFALLDPEEGSTLRGALDIAVGRLPVNTLQQAQTVVDKLIHYDTSPEKMGDWRLQLCFLADDEDNNKHINDADELTEFVAENYPLYNIEKLYFDAFPQVITPGGERFPAAKEAINKSVFKGNLVMNYFGHGGSTGLAQERVLEVSDINSWTNLNRLMLMITATCTFGSYDNPFQTSAGELVLLNPRGGAVGMMTTTRAVYAHSNRRLTFSVFRYIFEREDNKGLPIGEILRRGKNSTSEDTLQSNARKFTLLGDPSTLLPQARHSVRTLAINGVPINPSSPDTLKALNKYTLSAAVTDEQGNVLEWFNGQADVAVYDKETTQRTLGQNAGSSVRSFTLQRNVVFKGKARVTNGRFEFTFIVPKSINYAVGPGKISYYAWQDDLTDASGYSRDVLVGAAGEGADLSKNGPNVELFMNDFTFVSGGITHENPVLLGRIQADNGINLSGASIGHDLTATINSDDKNTRVLNDFFQTEIDDFTRGEIRYPLFNLEEGPQQIRVNAFDVAHNPGVGTVEFTVVKGGSISIKNLLNYPNPFTTRTQIQFEHNLAGIPIDLQVQVYSISGQLIKTIDQTMMPHGFLTTGIEFNGMDEYGQRLANGVYLYKVKVKGTDISGKSFTHESGFQKMVLLN
jgi:hypothetical protein